jgi:antitoxin component YwqK of YwqJK toxin-antitoxin module
VLLDFVPPGARRHVVEGLSATLCAVAATLTLCAGCGREAEKSTPVESKQEEVTLDFNVQPSAPATIVKEEVENEKYPSGNPRLTRGVRVMSDGSKVNHGHYVAYYENAQKSEEGDYVDGKQDGKWTYWFSNGRVCKEEQHRNGKLDGRWTQYREDGTKEREVGYVAGQREGQWTYYDPTGARPLRVESYKNNMPDGLTVYYDESGAKLRDARFKEGKLHGVQTRYFPSGGKKYENTYVEGKREGTETEWDEQGQVVSRQDYKAGQAVFKAVPEKQAK